MKTTQTRVLPHPNKSSKTGGLPEKDSIGVSHCPYCGGRDIVKRGTRKKKYQRAQLKDVEGRALCEDLIKRYILGRRKIFNLYKAWKRFEK